MFVFRMCDRIRHVNPKKNGHNNRPQHRTRKSLAIDLNAVALSDDNVSEH